MSPNISFPTEYSQASQLSFAAQILILLQIIVLALALILNAFVFWIGCAHIKDSFRHYLSNLAFIDMIFASGALISAAAQLRVFPMVLSLFAEYSVSITMPLMIVALIPISVDRYIKLDRLLNSIHIVIIPGFSLVIVFACNMALFRYVKRHQSVVGGLENRKRLIETRQLARATCLQAVAPLVLQLPPLLGIYSMNASQAVNNPAPNVIVWHLAHFLFLIIAVNPLWDALVTIFVVRKYRDYSRDFLGRFFPFDFLKPDDKSNNTTLQNSSVIRLSQINCSYNTYRGDETARSLLST